jgi:hypothetical protein
MGSYGWFITVLFSAYYGDTNIPQVQLHIKQNHTDDDDANDDNNNNIARQNISNSKTSFTRITWKQQRKKGQ